MKIKIKQTFRSMWATILAVLMLLSTFSAVAVTLNKEDTGANTSVESTGVDETTVYFDNTNTNWSSVYVHYWTKSPLNNSTGDARNIYHTTQGLRGDGSSVVDTSLDGNYYTASVPSNATYVAFTNKGGMTNYYTFNDCEVACLYTFNSSNNSMNIDDSNTFSSSTPLFTPTSTSNNIGGSSSKKYFSGTWSVYSGGGTTTTTSPTTPSTSRYYFRYDGNSWNGTSMTVSNDGYYEYYYISGGATQFLIGTTPTGTDYNHNNVTKNFNGTDVSDIGDYGATNAYVWKTDGPYYVLIYYPNTTINTTNNPIICASTTLPNDSPASYTVNTSVKVSTDGSSFTVDSTKTAPTGGGDVSASTGTTLTASEISGYTFVGWEVTAGATISSTNMSVSYTPTANTTVYALYKKNYTVSIGTHTNGKITVDGEGSNKTVPAGTQVTIVASPNPGYAFSAWTGDLSGESSATVTKKVTSDITANATFEEVTYTVTAKSGITGGTVYIGEENQTSQTIKHNGTVTVIAVPAENYIFKGWKSATGVSFADSKNATTTATITSDVTIEAEFISQNSDYLLIGNHVDFGGWDTSKAPPLYNTSTDNVVERSFSLTKGTKYLFNIYNSKTSTWIKPESDTKIDDVTSGDVWTGTINNTSTGERNFNITPSSNGIYTFTYNTRSGNLKITKAVLQHTIKVDNTITNGTISVDGELTADTGATVTLSNSPEPGYELDSYSVYKTGDTSTTVPVTGNTFQMPDYDVTVTATFKKIDYNMNCVAVPSSNSNYVICKNSSNVEITKAQKDDTVKFIAQEVSGYTFKEWSIVGADVTGLDLTSSEVNVTVGTSEITATATYEAKFFKVSSSEVTVGKGSFTVSGLNAENKAQFGSQVTVNPDPADGYELDTITVRKDVGGTPSTVDPTNNSFTMPDGAVTITVTFKKVVYTMTGAVADGSPTGAGVTPNPAQASIGDTVTFTATPVDGYNVSWNVTGVADDKYTVEGNTVTVEVGTENVTATANYEGNLFTVTKNSPSHGSYTVTGIDSNNQARCGSTVTITPTADPGYELDKITVRKTVGGTTSTVDLDDKSFTMPDGDVTITVTFKVQEVKFAIVGNLDNRNTYNTNYDSLDSKYKFSGIGSSIIVEKLSEFRLKNSSNKSFAQNVSMISGTTYDTTETTGVQFYNGGGNTWKITLVGVKSDGTPQVKVAKKSTYALYSGTKSGSTLTKEKIPVDFYDNGNGTYTAVGAFGIDNPKIFVHIEGGAFSPDTNSKANNYYGGGSFSIGDETQYWKYNNDSDFESKTLNTNTYNKSTVYECTLTPNDNNIKLLIKSISKPLADGVTLTANPTTQVIGKNVTLKATLNNVNDKIPADAQFTYTFYRGSVELGTATGTNVAPIAPVTFNTTYNTAGTQSYTVTVSTKESDIVNYTPTDYESVTSIPVDVEYRDVIYYYAAVNPDTGAVDTRNAIPADNKVETTVSDGGTYYFSVFDNDTDTSAESVVDYTVDSANNRYCTISKSSTETGLDYLIVKCNAKCSNPVIYFNKANKTVYAVATQNVGSSKTLDSEKKVTYYFAEEKYDSTDQSDPAAGGDGMRIKYWNNSVNNSTYTGYADVTTKVIRPGTDNNNKSEENNSIFVWVDKFPYPDGTTFPSTWNQNNRREFYIYSVDLPIWATSFSFVKANDTALTINNTSQISDNTTTASIVLNPNRVYCFLSFNYKNYVRGVVLDDSLWDGNARNTANSNEVATQGFASNIVNYKTVRNDTSGNVAFNTALTAKYGTDYKHPLYFNGWYGDNDNTIVNDTRTLYGSSYFRLHDNLAMRKSYFASVQNLTDNRLSTTKKNKMGNGYLLGYNGALMPLFDYEMLNDNKTTLVNNGQLYENVQFPFYASTFNGVTTYSYDSTTDRNRLVETTEDGKTTVNVSSSFVKNGNSYGYFPFGGTSDTNKYGSGTEFDINFYMTNNGKLSNGDDIAFNFSGDDDVWVYVDGVRVLDLGGAHSVSSGTINFSDMKVYYKTAGNATEKITNCNDTWVTDPTYVKTVSLTDLFEANGATFSNTDASTQHTLQMFYLERGQGESNCSISFNLPQNTGFRVNSNVTTDSVNKALVEDTMASANKDYFNYQIANKLATETEYTNVSTTFTNAPARAENVSGLTPSDTPNYPINSPLISREFLGTNYYLTATNATPSDSNNGWLNSVNNSTFTNLQNVNYTLSDAYAVKGTSDTESSPTGRVSGTGIFNLLFGQSAIFESKIPNNTMIQLSQNDTIYSVNAGNGDTTVITAGDASTRTVSNYYSSSYSIVDDNTGLELANKTQSVTDGKLFANDASANSNMFYFANYSGKTNTSSNAMTVTYTNDVLTSKIKLAKTVENPSATDNFYFKVEFSKIFGENLATAKEYTDLQYTVYNSSNEVVATRTYGKAGVYFTANQYAIIEGVPVDSAYKVVEKDRAGYKFDSASKTTYTGNTEDTTTNYNDNKVDGATVSGANGTTTYDAITFRNSKQAFTVNFKYYDRSVITGTTSHISTSPTTVTYSYDSVTNEYLISGSDESDIKYNLPKLITDAYAHYNNFDNVIDTYKIFTSQTAAEDSTNGAGSLKVLREDITGVEPGVTTYSTAYGSINGVDLGLHYDCYGRPQGTADCMVSDKEDWVTYYAGNTPISQTDAEKAGSRVNSITVWLYNTLKEYKPTFYYAPESASETHLKAITGTSDRYVATTNKSYTIPKDVYYNVRLGKFNGNSQNDAATDYLKEYGISKGYCEEVPNIVTDVTYTDENSGKKSLKFLYWASDPSGKTILSTDVAYGYRVTNNLKAYAVYGVNDFNAKGLTITPNTPDYYSNSTGKAYIRLNNVMNVYGCPERDRNIKNSSIIYIIDYSQADVDGKTQMDKLIEAGGFDELQAKVREVLKANEGSKNFVEGNNISIEAKKITFTKNSNGDIDITGFNHKVVPYNEALNPGTDDIKLTNKNRVQFTTSFTKSNLVRLKMYAMLGMDYGEVVTDKNSKDNSWIVSDNLLYYAFDEKGNVTSIKDPILKYTFYSTAP